MSVLDSQATVFSSHSPDQTRRIGARLGEALRAGDVICLQGDLGAGKTTFVQGVAKGWGSQDSVSSPTFIIVNEYGRTDSSRLFHMDAYRLESALEAEQLDLDSMLADGALLIEWPERIAELIPTEHLWISLDHKDKEEREMKFNASGKRYKELLDIIRQAVKEGE
jgi:tRNA threonylcarbamoyladenosine biosynthesis protein TsaE